MQSVDGDGGGGLGSALDSYLSVLPEIRNDDSKWMLRISDTGFK